MVALGGSLDKRLVGTDDRKMFNLMECKLKLINKILGKFTI